MLFKILQTALPLIWFGMVGAISFMEAPLKFRAPGLTRAVGLSIGKIVFRGLNRAEIVLAFLMVVSLFFERPAGNLALYLFGAVLFLLFVQTFWLLPQLNARAERIIGGEDAPPSRVHLIYVVLETAKFALLLILGVVLLKNNLRYE
jgi:hypothetical protein